MPFYKYRSKAPNCATCTRGFTKRERFEATPIANCRHCGAEVYRVIGNPHVKIARSLHGKTGDGHDYRSDLARFPGDPRANVDGPAAVRRLIDQTKREGGEVSTQPPSMTKPREKTNEEMMGEAYQRAKAKGFRPDNPETLKGMSNGD